MNASDEIKQGRAGAAGTLIIIGGHVEREGERLILEEVASHVPDGRLALFRSHPVSWKLNFANTKSRS